MAKISPLMVLPPVIFAAFGAMAYMGLGREGANDLESVFVGKPAPEVTAEPLPGYPALTREMLENGEVKLVNFWASWCAPCRVEHPNLDALSREGIPIYGINYKDDPANAAGFLEELGDPYVAIGVDGQGRTALDWGVYGVPETYVIAGDGTIMLRFAGPITQRVITETLRPALEAAAQR